MDEPVEVVRLVGFDPDGEPQERRMADGSLYVTFEFMPPSWAEDVPERFIIWNQVPHLTGAASALSGTCRCLGAAPVR
jgi:hypothetical protein